MLVQKIDREYNYPLTQELARGQLQNEKIVAKYYTNDSLSRSIVHSHPFVEMIMPVSGGDMIYSINGALYRLTVGDMVFIPEEIYHSVVLEESAEVSDRLVVQLEAEIWNRALERTGLRDPVWNRQVTVVDRDYAATWDIRGLFERMINTRHLKTEFQNAVLESQLVELQLLLEQTVTSRTTIAPSASSRVVASTVAYLQAHYTNPELNVGRLAQEAFVSREYLSRIFKEYTMQSVHSYLNNLRIQHARNAIAKGSSILDACMESGFNTYSSFYKAFRAIYGVTPADYKKQISLSLNAEHADGE